jgi:hypothetical protein
MERQNRTDPKAYPRTPDHDEGANAATDSIRYVCDNNNFQPLASDGFDNLLVEGTEGCAVEVSQVGDQIEIDLTLLRWDRLFIDPHSMKRDCSDARYIGYISWKDQEDVELEWPHAKSGIEHGMTQHSSVNDTTDDKPQRWYSPT